MVDEIPAWMANIAGIYLIVFLCLVFLFQILFHLTKLKTNFIDIVPRINFIYLSIGFASFIIVIYAVNKGFGAIIRPLEFRNFLEKGGMYYFVLVYLFLVTVGFIQVLSFEKKNKKLFFQKAFFIFFHIIFGVIAGKSAFVIGLLITYFLYLNMVKHKVPYKFVFFGITFLPLFATIHGFYRVRAVDSDFSFESIKTTAKEQMQDPVSFLAREVFHRIDQLENMSILLNALHDKELDYNPLFGFDLFPQFIPRAIYPDKPLNFTISMTSHFRPWMTEAGVGNVFTGLGEMVYMFNLFGILMASLITGYLLFLSDQYYKFCFRKPGAFLFYYLIVFSYLGNSFMSGYINDIGIPMALISLFLILLSCKIKIINLVGFD